MSEKNEKQRILVSDKLTDEGLEILSGGGRFEVVNEPEITTERMAEIIGEFDALVIRGRAEVTADVLARADRLKVIGRAGVGVDNVDVAAATARGVIVMNTPEANTLSTAEHTISMMLALARNIPRADRSMKAGEWAKKSIAGSELHGKTLGIVGVGKIGRVVADHMRGFGMKILGFDPYVTPAAGEKIGIGIVAIDELCRESDVITVHTPLNAQTRGIIDMERMELMKPSALLINCARGGIIDEDDLVKALKAGRIAGAALDVFTTEPLAADHPFRALENVVLSPHLAASTPEAQARVTREVAEQVVEVLKGGQARNAINAPSIDPREAERLAPVLTLTERLGRFASQFCPAPAEHVEILYCGTATEYPLAPLTNSLIKGFLQPYVDVPVNEVNASYLAKQRGIEVVESRCTDTFDYAGLITVNVTSAGGERNSISGTLFHGRFPRLVTINEKHFDVTPEGSMLVIQNRDVPGIIGSVATAIGRRGVNIADMTWGRSGAGGEAITVINVDDGVPPELIDEIKALENVLSCQLIVV